MKLEEILQKLAAFWPCATRSRLAVAPFGPWPCVAYSQRFCRISTSTRQQQRAGRPKRAPLFIDATGGGIKQGRDSMVAKSEFILYIENLSSATRSADVK